MVFILFFRALTSLTGYNIGTHHIEEHLQTFVQSELNDHSNENEDPYAQNSIHRVSEPIGSIGLEGSTDVYIYGVDAQEGLVKTDEMIR